MWITVLEAAKLTSYSEEYIRRLARTDQVTSEKRNRSIFIEERSLLFYLEAMIEDSRGQCGPRRR